MLSTQFDKFNAIKRDSHAADLLFKIDQSASIKTTIEKKALKVLTQLVNTWNHTESDVRLRLACCDQLFRELAEFAKKLRQVKETTRFAYEKLAE